MIHAHDHTDTQPGWTLVFSAMAVSGFLMGLVVGWALWG